MLKSAPSQFFAVSSSGGGGSEPDGTTTVKGIVRFAEHGESTPLEAMQSDDPRLPSAGEGDALTGTFNSPSDTNPYVTFDDFSVVDGGSF